MWLALHAVDGLVGDIIRDLSFLLQLITVARTIVGACYLEGRIYIYRCRYIEIYTHIYHGVMSGKLLTMVM
jgi:hypothetical protein